VDNVLGVRAEKSQEDLNQLEYTGCVFKEALRKWPPVSGVSRRTNTDTHIEGLLTKGLVDMCWLNFFDK
jgi:hypothetical protein